MVSQSTMESLIPGQLERIKKWMNKHAPLLTANLAPGAPKSRLDKLESDLGFTLPSDLRILWSIHNGQKEKLNGFMGSLDLYNVDWALAGYKSVMTFIAFLRQHEERWPAAMVTREEAASASWLPFAGRDSDTLVVSGVSGRVFTCGKDSPPIHLAAESIAEWFTKYADGIEAGRYQVEEGFGDYYLSR